MASYLQVGVETVWRYTREGKLPAVKLGNHYRYPIDETMAALGKSSEPASAPAAVRPSERMTLEEFAQLPEQAGLQLIDGFLVQQPSPAYGHQYFVGEVYFQMAMHVRQRDLGQVIISPFDVHLADDQVLQPDVMFVTRERESIIQDRALQGAPDLAVEALSPSTRQYDLGRKRALYYEHGCRELWIVDTVERWVRLGVRGATDWEDAQLERGDVITSQVLADFRLDLDNLFHNPA